MIADLRRLTKALLFAAEAHRNQRRKGAAQEPYLNHLIEVLDLVVQARGDADMDMVIAALLHDVVEDTPTGVRDKNRRSRSSHIRLDGRGCLAYMAGFWVVDHPMRTSYPVDETRIADAVEQTKRQQRSHAKRVGGTTKARPKRRARMKGAVASRARTKRTIKKQTKQRTCIDLLCRREGATIEESQAATGWQQHTVRGFLAGAVRKKLGLTLLSEKPDAGLRRNWSATHSNPKRLRGVKLR
jgi:hypothetical protein